MVRESEVQKWDIMHSNEHSRLKYPSEAVIRFLKSQYRTPEQATILDLGCGSGRHLFYMREEGFRVAGLDYSKSCVEYVQGYFRERSWEGEIVQSSVTELPFGDSSFDGIISHGVLLYLQKADIERAVGEIYRVLKPGGKALIVVRGTEDMRFGMGTEIEPDTFILNNDSTNENGLTMHFFRPEEIRGLFAAFSETKIGFLHYAQSDLNAYNADYLITITK